MRMLSTGLNLRMFLRFLLKILISIAVFSAGRADCFSCSIKDHVTTNRLYRTFSTYDLLSCLTECRLDPSCVSYNHEYEIDHSESRHICQLSRCGTDRNLVEKKGFWVHQLRTSQNEECNTLEGKAPVDGNFTEWSKWTGCSLTCGNGTQQRMRNCMNSAPANGGANCSEPSNETRFCNTQLCPNGLEVSAILQSPHSKYLNDLLKFLSPVERTWKRCYWNGSSDFNAGAFHAQCNNKGPTITIVRVGKYVFGGYIDKSWTNATSCVFDGVWSNKSFLFSIYSHHDGYRPLTFAVKDYKYAAFHCPLYGPTLGTDLKIMERENQSVNMPQYYEIPFPCKAKKECTYYTGQLYFTAREVEVFYQEK